MGSGTVPPPTPPTDPSLAVAGGSTPLDGIDLILADLDGVVYRGAEAIPHAVDGLLSSGVPVAYVTNNASRTVETIAEHLSGLGLPVRG